MQLVLSLFPGIGLLDMAFEEAGFCVVRGPDRLWGGDIKRFTPPRGRFDGVIGGPPCQRFSKMAGIVRKRYGEAALAENLIPEFERCVAAAAPAWFLMENVEAAPLPEVDGYAISNVVLDNRWFGAEQQRRRRISFGVRGAAAVDLGRYLEFAPFESANWARTVLAGGAVRDDVDLRGGSYRPGQRDALRFKTGPTHKTVAEAIRLQGLPEDFLADAPFTIEGKQKVVGNGVPLPLGRALASAVREALGFEAVAA